MMRRWLAALAAVLIALPPLARAQSLTPGLAPNAVNATVPAAPNFLLGNATGSTYFANAYNGAVSGVACTWDAFHDVGDCVNSAIAAAATAGAGTVMLPAGNFGVSVPIVLQRSLVRLVAPGGGGGHHDVGTIPTGGTILTWLGSVGGTIMQGAPVTGPASQALTGVGVDNVTFNCGGPGTTNTAGIGLQLLNVRQSTFNNMVMQECSAAGLDLSVNSQLGEGKGDTQLVFNNLETDNFANGDGGVGVRINGDAAPSDGSFITFSNTSHFFHNAPGIRIIQGDNNRFYNVKYYRATGGAAPCAVDFNQSYAISLGANSNLVVGIGGSAASGTAYHFCAVGTGGSDGVSNGTTTYTSATGDFSAADVGKGITGTNIPGSTTIAAVVSPTQITLSQAATGSGSGLSYTVTTRSAALQNTVLGMDYANGEGFPPPLGTGATATWQEDHGRTAGLDVINGVHVESWGNTAAAESRKPAAVSGYFYNSSGDALRIDNGTIMWGLNQTGNDLQLSIPGTGQSFTCSATTLGCTFNGVLSTPGTLNLASAAAATQIANAGATGTTLNKLAKLTGAPSSAVITATTDTDGAVGVVVAGAGTTGSAQIATAGQASCIFDGATTAGDWVGYSSTTAGDCHDAGATRPTHGIGRVLSTNAAGGTFAILVAPF